MNFEKLGMTIDGKTVSGPATIDVINPATGQAFAKAPDCSKDELDQAVAAARRAQPAWAAVPFEERRRRVAALGQIVTDNAEELKRLLTMEQGKPHDAAAGELMGAAYWFAAAAELELPVTVLEDTDDRRTESRHVPLGVVGGIMAWNFPVLIFAFKVIPALLAGNTIVAKPSPYTPLSTLALGELFAKQFPPGVINVVSGGDDLGRWMTEHPGIDKISFTGSSATGKKIVASAAGTMKRVSLELGGNDAAIIMPDVDVAAASQSLFWGAFNNSGQVCIAVKRVYVHEDIYDKFSQAMMDIAKTVKIGDGAQQGTQLGPMQNRMQYDKVKELIADARDKNYKVTSYGEAPAGGGYFLPLTIVDNPPENARIVQEEQFGPVLPLMKFNDVEDALKRANATRYGLSGSVWSADAERALDVARRMECGTVWVNTIHDSLPTSPISGFKESGLGLENGNPGLLEYTNLQTVTVRKRPAVIA